MLAAEICDFIAKNAPVSLRSIANHFGLDESVIQMLIGLLIKSGKVTKHSFGSPCCNDGKRCGNCVIDSLELYDITNNANNSLGSKCG